MVSKAATGVRLMACGAATCLPLSTEESQCVGGPKCLKLDGTSAQVPQAAQSARMLTSPETFPGLCGKDYTEG